MYGYNFTPGKEPVPILKEAGWDTGPAWTGGESRPHRDSIGKRNDSENVETIETHILCSIIYFSQTVPFIR